MTEFTNDKIKTVAIAPRSKITEGSTTSAVIDLYKILEAYSSLPFDKESSTKFGRIQPVSEGMYSHFISALSLSLPIGKVFSRIHEVSEGASTLLLTYTEFIDILSGYKKSIANSQSALINRLSQVSEELTYLKAFDSLTSEDTE